MTFYLYIQENKINGAGQCRQLTEGVLNYEVDSITYETYLESPEKYIWDGESVAENPNYEQEQAQKSREYLDMLTLTAADVERAIYKAKGIDFESILDMVKQNTDIDFKALRIEFKANNFYRGNPYVNIVGELLGYTSDDLDYLFMNKELPQEDSDE